MAADSDTNWALGLSLCLLNCFMSSLGLTFQRLSALRQQAQEELKLQQSNEASSSSRELQIEMPEQNARRCCCEPLWWMGVALYVLAGVPDVISYVLVPQVVISAVYCFRLVVVTIMACTLLGEKLSRWQTLGMFACTLGTLICVCFGPVRMERAAFAGHFSEPQVAIYLISGGSIFLLLLVVEHLDSFSAKCASLSARWRSFTLPLLTGLAFAISKVFNTEIGFVPVHNGQWWNEPSWIILSVAVLLLALTDLYLNLRATRLMAVHVFVPVSFVWIITFQYFQSVALFDELDGLGVAQITLSITGACLSLVGAIGLQLPQKSDKSSQEQDKLDLIGSNPSQSGVSLQDRQVRMLLDC